MVNKLSFSLLWCQQLSWLVWIAAVSCVVVKDCQMKQTFRRSFMSSEDYSDSVIFVKIYFFCDHFRYHFLIIFLLSLSPFYRFRCH